MNKETLTETTIGTIVDAQDSSDGFGVMSRRLTVSYSANGRNYAISEWAALRSEAIRLGPIPIGQRKAFKLRDTRIGAQVEVLYDPADPVRATIRGNEGHIKG